MTRAQLKALLEGLAADYPNGAPWPFTLHVSVALEPDKAEPAYTDADGVSAWPEGEQPFDFSAYVGKRGGG